MGQHVIRVPHAAQEWLYVPDIPYETVGNVTRCLQLIYVPWNERMPAWKRRGQMEQPH